MVFSSITFLLYFMPVFFLVYYALPYKFKNFWLVISSLLFYSWGAPVFVFAFVASSVFDFLATTQFHKPYGKKIFIGAIASNILLLGYFKYSNFFVDNFNIFTTSFLGFEIPWSHVILPIGISFLTFEKISYLIDVYRKECESQRNYFDYLLFVILFPHQIAGPIVRYKEISTQIKNRSQNLNSISIYEGLLRFTTGLGKKVLIANVLGEQVTAIFDLPVSDITFTSAWIGILTYSFQIYFDFSGYSDMAIGMGKMLGFKFPENFNFPYTSKSITEFWKRWHITLGNWMKDYLYIPLGGNRANHTYRNLMIVFLISGFWHGASWNFVIWGAIHGLFLVIERLGWNKTLTKLHPSLAILYTFLIVLSAWVFFRSENISYSLAYLKTMYTIPAFDMHFLMGLNTKFYFVGMIAMIFSFMAQKYQARLADFYIIMIEGLPARILQGLLMVAIYVFALGELIATGFNPFIYFKF